MRGLELPLELIALAVAAKKEIPINALEITIDVFLRRDRLDAINCSSVTLGSKARSALSVKLLDLVVAIIESAGQVSGGATGFSAANGAVIYYSDSATRASQEICRAHTGDSGTNHAYADSEVLGKPWKLGRIACGHPD
jgi:hypothetical protein